MADTVATLPGTLTHSAPQPPEPPPGQPYGRRSPLQDRADELARAGRPGPYGVELREVPFLTQFNLRVRERGPRSAYGLLPAAPLDFPLPLALPGTPNTVLRSGDRAAVWLGPDEWLIVTPPGTAAETDDTLRAAADTARGADGGGEGGGGSGSGSDGGVDIAYTDVSAHSTTLRLGGARARDVLRKVCPIDLHPRVFGSGACAQTLLAGGARVLLVADREPDGFLVFVRASFADYVTDWLLDSMTEYAAGDGHFRNEER
ncbi:sarcosine oxidase subunit gamma [Streptomyces armeniacus]|uniref:Sarcosine oxidase subunit gamma n=1 Tax=Streptomyces armeniacus TaxID=83291 RepID=A0A345XXI4_9ACTN|nr:sarcosine oxidase subunit gamma family protein [Streptomyces armeniacus]AXK36350.1 sarcosine oxidase subunit gamma [Streptomyces armeniacus]